jgi:cyclic-di-GMP-binding protein
LICPFPYAPPLEIRPKQAKAWLESLPLAESIETAKKIRVNLAGLSRAKIELDDRLARASGTW